MTSILLAVGLWTTPALAAKNKPCWLPSRMSYAGRSALEFTSLEDARQRESQAARLEQREARDILAPWLALKLERLTLDGADPKHQLIVVEKDGAEVHRYAPPSDIPSLGTSSGSDIYGFWWIYAVVQLPEGVAPPLEVSAIDRLHQMKCVWSVDESGEVQLTSKAKGLEDSEG